MKIVIAGAGEVGTHLAKQLSHEQQDITVIDRDMEKLLPLDANYNLLTVNGSPLSFQTLKDSGVEGCDLYIAVTPYETENLVSCSVARSIGAKKTVARIDNFEYKDPRHREFFGSIGVNDLIYPEYLAALDIMSALTHNWARHWFELHDGELILVAVKLRQGAKLVGMQLKELAVREHNFHVAAIKRGYETIIPRGDDYVRDGDIVYFTTTRDYVNELADICGKVRRKIKEVMIMGGTRIAIQLAQRGAHKYNFKIIENDHARCLKLSEQCPEAQIIHADAHDAEALRDEGIADMDAFIALTESSETNILTCLAAKEAGVPKTIAEVEKMHFIRSAEGLNIGMVVNKKLLASSRIFQILLDADSASPKCLALADAEVAEIEVKPGSKITKAPVKDLHLSRDMTIAGLIRDGKGEMVTGATHIQAGDRVLVFSLNGMLHNVEKLFL